MGRRLRKDGLTIVGVETPEFPFEKDAGNVADAIQPVRPALPGRPGQQHGHLERLGNEYWPADYLIDAKGKVRYATFGEGDYGKTETAIRALLAEAGHQVGGRSHAQRCGRALADRHAGDLPGHRAGAGLDRRPRRPGTHDYGPAPSGELAAQRLRLRRHLEDRRTAGRSGRRRRVDLEFKAKNAISC